MSRTTVNLDDDALTRARELYGTHSTSDVVNNALRDVVRSARLAGFDPVEDVALDLTHDQLRSWRDDGA